MASANPFGGLNLGFLQQLGGGGVNTIDRGRATPGMVLQQQANARAARLGTQRLAELTFMPQMEQLSQQESRFNALAGALGIVSKGGKINYGALSGLLGPATYSETSGSGSGGSPDPSLLAEIERVRGLRSNEINQQFDDAHKENLAHLQRRGLAGSTLLANLSQGTERQRQSARTELDTGVLDTRIGLHESAANRALQARQMQIPIVAQLLGLLR